MCNHCGKELSGKALNKKIPNTQLSKCNHCGCIVGRCYLGQSYEVLLPYFCSQEEEKAAKPCPYDFETLGSNGIQRHHGILDLNTKKIIQVG
jgi:hypothetical protein